MEAFGKVSKVEKLSIINAYLGTYCRKIIICEARTNLIIAVKESKQKLLI